MEKIGLVPPTVFMLSATVCCAGNIIQYEMQILVYDRLNTILHIKVSPPCIADTIVIK